MSERVEIYLVCYGCEIVSALHIVVAVSDNPFLCLLELEEFCPYLLQCGIVRGDDTSLDVYAFYLVVVFCFLYSSENVVQSEGVGLVACQHSEYVFSALLCYVTLQVEHEYGVVLYLRL